MQQNYKSVWVIVNRHGVYMPRYWARTKRGVIEQWEDDIPEPHKVRWWKYKEDGWKAVRVNITVEPDEKYYKGKKV